MFKCVRAVPALLLLCVLASSVVAQKLPYPARQAVQRQESNVKKVARGLAFFNDIEKLKREVTITPRQVQSWVNSLQGTLNLCDSIENDITKNKAPKDHPKVKAIYDAVAKYRKRVEVIRGELNGLAGEAKKASSASTYGDPKKDLGQVQMIIDTYRITNLTSDVDATIGVIAELPRITRWLEERWTAYQPFFKQRTGEANTLHTKMKWARKILTRLGETCTKYEKDAPNSIDRHLSMAEDMIKRATEKKNPLMLKHGVKQSLGNADKELRVLEAVAGADDANVKSLRHRLSKRRTEVGEAEVALQEQILSDARVPAAAYAGDDKADFEKRIRAAWAKAWPKDEILEVRFHQKDWKRTKKVVWNKADKSWEAVDKGFLAALVICKTGDTIVTCFPAFINKDYIANSSNIGVQTKGGRYVIRRVLAKNYK